MKKFINNVDDIVKEMIEGIVLSNPDTLSSINDFDVITRKVINKNKVSLISGGGSGHEPAHAGYVGYGMLDAAVCGPVFTSPTPDKIFEALKATKSDKGSLLIVKNYTGDILNFEMAMDMASMEDINTKMVVVDDDVSLDENKSTTGKRGIAGTVLVEKIAGAKAETLATLDQVYETTMKAIKNVATFGISSDACIVPANGKKGFTLTEDEVELGLGIHGEPGIEKVKMKKADEFSEIIFNKIIKSLGLKKNDEVAIMINGLGGTPLMELNIVARKTLKLAAAFGLKNAKTFVGNYMTAIEMPGFSISILKLDKELKELLLAKSNTIGMSVN